MVSDLLLEAFGQMVSQAGDVGKLNAAILQLAVQGKLVAQDPNDEPASELLKRIAAEKKRLKIKSEPLPEIGEEERPFPLPDSWEWVRLGNVAAYGTPEKADARSANPDTWVLDLEDIEKTSSRLIQRMRFKERPFKSTKSVFRIGDVLYGKLRPYLDKVLVADEVGVCTTEIVPIRVQYGVDPHYLKIALKSPEFINYVNARTFGVKMPRLGTKDAENAPIPLPPLAEQMRIVERVDALLAQTRELESRLSQAETTLTALHETAVNTLLSATDPDDFTVRWQFIAENFDTLYDEAYPEAALANVAALKQAILQLAVQGKLTRQDPADEPASALLSRIAAEKERLGTKSKKLAEIGEEERPYVLPDGWEWVTLTDVAHVGTGATPLRTDSRYWEDGTIPWITSSSTNELFVTHASEYVSALALKETNLTIYPKNTLIVAMYGQGKTRGQVSELLLETTTNQACAAIVFYESAKETKDYVKLFFQKNYDEIRLLAEGGAQPNLNLGKVKSTIFPFPPLAEQKRIVTRVNALLRLCDELSAHIQEAQATRVALRDAVLSS